MPAIPAAQAVFNVVREEYSRRPDYDPVLHDRVDALIHHWLKTPEGAPCGRAFHAADADVRACRRWTAREYRRRYASPMLLGWLLWPITEALIGWLVRRTLDRLFPNAAA